MASSTCGIAISFAAAITGSFEGGFGIYAFAGLAAGVFGSLGKYAQAISVVATGIIGLSFVEFKAGSAAFFTEMLIGALLFVLIPRSSGITLSKFFYRQPHLHSQDSVNQALTMRLNLASHALLDVSDTISIGKFVA